MFGRIFRAGRGALRRHREEMAAVVQEGGDADLAKAVH